MSKSPGDEPNPYAPPSAEIGAEAEASGIDPADLARRRSRLGAERAIRAVGAVYCIVGALAVAFLLLASAAIVERMFRYHFSSAQYAIRDLLLLGLFLLMACGVIVLGRALRRFKPWARWVAALYGVPVGLVLAWWGPDVIIGSVGWWLLVAGPSLLLLVSRKAAEVFTPEHRALAARTPPIRRL